MKKVLDLEIWRAGETDTKSDNSHNDYDEPTLKISINAVKTLMQECEVINKIWFLLYKSVKSAIDSS